jgi:uncharacterized membrane protein YedE/YeeE
MWFRLVFSHIHEILYLELNSKILLLISEVLYTTWQLCSVYYFACSIIVVVCFQMILLMAVAHGKSRVKCGPITLHTQTAIHVAHQLTEVRLIRYY